MDILFTPTKYYTTPEGGTYIRGAIPGTPNNHDMSNAITYNAGENFPGEPQKGDIYQYGDYEYVYGYYLEETGYGYNSAPSGIDYDVNNTSISNLLITNNPDEQLYQYDTQFIIIGPSYDVRWISAEGHFEDSEGYGVAIKSFAYDPQKTYYVDILSVINGGNVINMSGTFAASNYDVSALEDKMIIPETIKYMNYIWIDGFDFNINNNEILRINSEVVSRIENVYWNYMQIIEVPADSLTYDTFMAAKANGEISETVTITTFVKE